MKMTKGMKEAAFNALRERIFTNEREAMAAREDDLFQKIAKHVWGAKAWQMVNDLLAAKPNCIPLRESVQIDTWRTKINGKASLPLPTDAPYSTPCYTHAEIGAQLSAKVGAHCEERRLLKERIEAVESKVRSAVYGSSTTDALYVKFPELRELLNKNPSFIEGRAANIAVFIDADTRKALGFPPVPGAADKPAEKPARKKAAKA